MKIWNKLEITSDLRQSGKSYVLGKIIKMLESEGYEVIIADGVSYKTLMDKGLRPTNSMLEGGNLDHIIWFGIETIVKELKPDAT